MLYGIGICAALIAVWGYFAGLRYFEVRKPVEFDQDEAKRLFRYRREWLEAEFISAAEAASIHRWRLGDMLWDQCEFGDDVQFACDEKTGYLRAFVALNVRCEAVIRSGNTEEIVGSIRRATMFFEYDGKAWKANPKAIFNLTPGEAIEQFRHRLVPAD